jgi:hypothetical protein
VIAQLERLAAAGFQILPLEGLETHFVLERDGFVALVERKVDGFGGTGSAGLLTGKGFAALVWRGERAFFVGKGFEQAATVGQVAALRRFDADLRVVLGEATEPLR